MDPSCSAYARNADPFAALCGVFMRRSLLSLSFFVMALLPGFLQVAWYYLRSPDIVRNVCFGPNPRNMLDIYLPTDATAASRTQTPASDSDGATTPRPLRPVVRFLSPSVPSLCPPPPGVAMSLTTPAPLHCPRHCPPRPFLSALSRLSLALSLRPSAPPQVVFISGGVWTIGYKAWGAFFGRILASQGIVTVMADYRNFPQGRIQHMMQDVDAALAWVHNNILDYEGDPNCIHLMGAVRNPAHVQRRRRVRGSPRFGAARLQGNRRAPTWSRWSRCSRRGRRRTRPRCARARRWRARRGTARCRGASAPAGRATTAACRTLASSSGTSPQTGGYAGERKRR